MKFKCYECKQVLPEDKGIFVHMELEKYIPVVLICVCEDCFVKHQDEEKK